MSATPVVVRRAEVDGRLVDIRCTDGRIEAVGPGLDGADAEHDAQGGAVVPGLHDHHIHLLALAAARSSTSVEHVADPMAFDAALRAADREQGWLRVVGFHESTMGLLDRHRLDLLVPSRPVRVQHATGAMWVFNSVAVAAAGVDELDVDGVERDGDGRPTGRLYGLDDVLRRRTPDVPVDLAGVGSLLAALGITGVTDLTPTTDRSTVELLSRHVLDDRFPVDVTITGGLDLPDDAAPALARGPVKLLAADHRMPSPDDLAGDIATAHRRGRPVAVHCASLAGLVVAVAALEQSGTRDGDRIEHGAVVPFDLVDRLRALGVSVVTQPSFVVDRGDRYLREVSADEQANLWRCGSLIRGGVAVAVGSDAPYGDPDPWLAIAAAAERRTRGGRPLGLDERIPISQCLAMYLTTAGAPAGATRRIAPGQPARLCVLDRPLTEVLRSPAASMVQGIVGRAGWHEAMR